MAPRRTLVRKRSPTATLLPPSLLLLDQLTLELSAAKSARGDAAYTLALAHRATGVKWTQPPRAFEDFRQLQQRLLTALRRGHVCSADCAYLYSFVKSCFPKSALFGRSSACLMEKRRAELALCLARLQQSVLARENHGCSVLVGDVARELEAFIVGDVRRAEHPLHDALVLLASSSSSPNSFGADDCGASTTSRGSCDSMLSATSSEGDFSTDDACPCVCSLCNSSLDGEAFATSPTATKQTASSSCSSVSSRSSMQKSPCSGLSYTTTLGCGHQFHDECIVPKLNESMKCPTCGHDELAMRS